MFAKTFDSGFSEHTTSKSLSKLGRASVAANDLDAPLLICMPKCLLGGVIGSRTAQRPKTPSVSNVRDGMRRPAPLGCDKLPGNALEVQRRRP
jgi:hypothetical protein